MKLDILAVDECAQDLLRAYERLGVNALVIALIDDTIVVRCQETADVVPLCKRVLSEMEIPGDRTVN